MAAQRPSLRLPQSMRLKQRRDFTELKQQGQRLAAGCLIANWTTSPAGSGSRLGVITSRKLGSAVTRSRARRVLRETVPLHQHDFREAGDTVRVGRPSLPGKQPGEVGSGFFLVVRQGPLLDQQ